MSSRRAARARHTSYTAARGDAQLAALRLGSLDAFWRDPDAIAATFPTLAGPMLSPLRIRGAWYRAANAWAARHGLADVDTGTDWHALSAVLTPTTHASTSTKPRSAVVAM